MGNGARCRMAQATAPILDSTYPEAFEGANEFRSLRCCGPVLTLRDIPVEMRDPNQR
jgi:hypothetical protein